VSTTLTVSITLKVSLSFIVTLYSQYYKRVALKLIQTGQICVSSTTYGCNSFRNRKVCMNPHTPLLHVLGGSARIETWCLVLKYLESK
jgi:hypothetical protein